MPQRGFNTGRWTMQEFQELSCHAKLLWIYLGNNDHCNHAALYRISLTTIHNETKIPEAELPALFEELKSDVVWHPDIHTVWVKSFLQEQSLGPLFMRGVSRILEAADPQLVTPYLEHNRSMGIQIPMVNGKGLETLSKPLEEGLPTVSKPRRQDKTRQDLSVLSLGDVSITDNVSYSLFSEHLFSLVESELASLPAGVDKLVQHESMKQKLAEVGIAQGFQSRSEYTTPHGRIDICWLKGEAIVAAFEIDRVNARARSVEKLRGLGLAHAYVVSRVTPPKLIALGEILTDKDHAEKVAEVFNQICAAILPRVVHLKGTAREKEVAARWREHPDLQWWQEYFRKVVASPLLSGQKNGWNATFDWLIEPKNMIKVVEGNYDGGSSTGPSARSLPNGEALKKGWGKPP